MGDTPALTAEAVALGRESMDTEPIRRAARDRGLPIGISRGNRELFALPEHAGWLAKRGY